ncbi:MAG: hypothetical protein ABI369_13435 [Acetobacteraceae bacterium]
MTKLPLNPETEALARRLVWFEDPADALARPIRFVAYALERGTHEDITVLRRYLTDADIKEALAAAPPGIIGPRSWAYWNARMGRYPTPPLPSRRLGVILTVQDIATGIATTRKR